MLNILCIVSHDQKKSPENQNYFGGGDRMVQDWWLLNPPSNKYGLSNDVILKSFGHRVETRSSPWYQHGTRPVFIYLFCLRNNKFCVCVCVQSVPAYNGNACNFFAETPQRLTVSLLQRVSHFEWLMATSSHAPGVCCFFLSKSTRNILN